MNKAYVKKSHVGKALAILSFTLASLSGVRGQAAEAQDGSSYTENNWKSNFEYSLDQAIDAVHKRKETCPGCGTYDPGRPENACHEKYLQTYRHEPVEMTLALGYRDDNDGRTDDEAQREVLVSRLTRTTCGVGDGACGFVQVKGDDELFVKHMKAGPDGKPRTVRLRIVESSYSGNDLQNRGMFKEQQDDQSQHAKDVYLQCQSEGDVCAYEGHARQGGGPSFGPVKRVVAKNGKVTETVDLNYTRAHPQDFHDLTSALAGQQQYPGMRDAAPPSINAVIACNGEGFNHFAQPILNASPSSGLVLTDGEVSKEVELVQTFEFFDSILAMRCQTDFVTDMGILQATGLSKDNNPITMHNYLPADPAYVAPTTTLPPVTAPVERTADPALQQSPPAGGDASIPFDDPGTVNPAPAAH